MKRFIVPALGLLALLAAAPGLRADFLGDLVDRAADTAKDRALREVDEGVDSSISGAKEGVKKGVSGSAEKAGASKPAGAGGSSAAPGGEGTSRAEEAAPAVDAGSDFTPGSRVVAEVKYDREVLGNFPRGLKLNSGNAEVATVGGRRFLRFTSFGEFSVPLPEVLPLRFTMEFDYAGPGGWEDKIRFDEREDSHYVVISSYEGGVMGPGGAKFMSRAKGTEPHKVFPAKVMADGSYVKVYMNGVRVANVPTAMIGRSRQVRLEISADADSPVLIGPIRIAQGGRSLYQSLKETGRVSAEGILFDTNSDRIRPESAGVLKEIGDMLKAHADLQLVIEGHTDNVGAEAANQALSEKRAAAVRAWLLGNAKLAAGRLKAVGRGSGVPVASNETAEGRQSNRRVELSEP